MSDAHLPENDPDSVQRQDNLQKNQKKYRYKYDYKSLDGLAMADGIPCQEYPRFIWIKKVIATFLRIIINQILNTLSLTRLYKFILAFLYRFCPAKKLSKSTLGTKRPQQMSDYIRYFKSLNIPEITLSYQEDSVFARMRVAGQNPVIIAAVAAINNNFPVSDALFQSVEGFAHDTLAQAIADQRLYIVDYKDLEHVKNGNKGYGQKYSYAPKAMFAIPADHSCLKDTLLPVAIQCGQIAGDENPIYTPNDGISWNMAKTIVQIADFNCHELIVHLAATHLLIEPFVVSTHRQFADNHPLKVLLLPHFEGTLFINWAAQALLVNDGGTVDQIFSGTIESNREIVANTLKQSFNDEMFPLKMKRRGVDNPALVYPYRDDAERIWQAISDWVSSYLDLYYRDDQDILSDKELAAWTKELGEEGRVIGFGNEDKKITTLDYLKQAVTMIIFTSSAQHAAVNFTQHDFSGYTPNMPAAGYTPAPQTDEQSTQSLLGLLPPLNMAAEQVKLTFLLSDVYYTKLGQYKPGYFNDEAIEPLLNKFKAELDNIEEKISARNEKTDSAGMMPYNYLLPSNIPQSINI